MKVQKVIRAQGEYAKKKVDIIDGDLITILDEGQVVTGDYGDRMVFKVETRNGPKNLSFNQKSMNNLIDALGDETIKWVGKKVKIWMIRALVSGKFQQVVYLADPSWMMAEDGTFHGLNGAPVAPQRPQNAPQAKEVADSDIPVVNVDEDINIGDLPF